MPADCSPPTTVLGIETDPYLEGHANALRLQPSHDRHRYQIAQQKPAVQD